MSIKEMNEIERIIKHKKSLTHIDKNFENKTKEKLENVDEEMLDIEVELIKRGILGTSGFPKPSENNEMFKEIEHHKETEDMNENKAENKMLSDEFMKYEENENSDENNDTNPTNELNENDNLPQVDIALLDLITTNVWEIKTEQEQEKDKEYMERLLLLKFYILKFIDVDENGNIKYGKSFKNMRKNTFYSHESAIVHVVLHYMKPEEKKLFIIDNKILCPFCNTANLYNLNVKTGHLSVYGTINQITPKACYKKMEILLENGKYKTNANKCANKRGLSEVKQREKIISILKPKDGSTESKERMTRTLNENFTGKIVFCYVNENFNKYLNFVIATYDDDIRLKMYINTYTVIINTKRLRI